MKRSVVLLPPISGACRTLHVACLHRCNVETKVSRRQNNITIYPPAYDHTMLITWRCSSIKTMGIDECAHALVNRAITCQRRAESSVLGESCSRRRLWGKPPLVNNQPISAEEAWPCARAARCPTSSQSKLDCLEKGTSALVCLVLIMNFLCECQFCI